MTVLRNYYLGKFFAFCLTDEPTDRPTFARMGAVGGGWGWWFETYLGADYIRRAGPVSRAGSVCRDLGMSVKHIKNQLCDYMEKSQPG